MILTICPVPQALVVKITAASDKALARIANFFDIRVADVQSISVLSFTLPYLALISKVTGAASWGQGLAMVI